MRLRSNAKGSWVWSLWLRIQLFGLCVDDVGLGLSGLGLQGRLQTLALKRLGSRDQ